MPIVDCFTSFFAGFVIFTVLGFMAHQKGTTIEEVARGGIHCYYLLVKQIIEN